LKPLKNYSPCVVAVAFLSSFAYIILFFVARYYEHSWWVVIINIIYALFALGSVIMDRMEKIQGTQNSKLITLGVATSAIAVSIMESIFVLAEHPTGGNGTLIIFFSIVTVLIYLLLLLAALLIPIKY